MVAVDAVAKVALTRAAVGGACLRGPRSTSGSPISSALAQSICSFFSLDIFIQHPQRKILSSGKCTGR